MIVKYRQQYQEMADLIGAQDYEAALRNMVGAGLSAPRDFREIRHPISQHHTAATPPWTGHDRRTQQGYARAHGARQEVTMGRYMRKRKSLHYTRKADSYKESAV